MRLVKQASTISFILYFSTSYILNAQTGVLDSTFNLDGIHRFDFGFSGNDNCVGTIVQSNGRIFSYGSTYSDVTNNDIAVVQYAMDGDLDTDFGDFGYITLKENNKFESELVADVAIQNDRKIIMVGRKGLFNDDDICLLRILTDGTPDSTFGNYGWVFTDLGSNFEEGLSVDIQSDQKIIVTANDDLFTPKLILLRYNPSGSLDSTFGEDGKVIHTFNSSDHGSVILVQPDNSILIGGYTSGPNGSVFASWRLDSNGRVDSLFGNRGIAAIDISEIDHGERGVAMSVDQDKIIIAGNVNNPDSVNKYSAVIRILNNGQLDSSFNSNGIYKLDIENNFEVSGMAIQQDHKILLSGNISKLSGGTEWFLARLQPNGGLDTTFGNDGLIVQPAEFGNAFNGEVAIQHDNKIILSGSSGSLSNSDFETRRYNPGIVIPFQSTPISCSGLSNGSLIFYPEGGNPPYLFSLNNQPFQADSIFNDLHSGLYTITVKDVSGLYGILGPIEVGDFIQPIVNVLTLENDIVIHVIQGGLPPYQYSIDGGVVFSSENIFTDLEDGTYSIVIKDSLDCILDTSMVTILFSKLENISSSSVSFYPNPSNGNFTLAAKDLANQTLKINLFDIAGKLIMSRKYSINDSGNLPITLSGLEQGLYLLSIETFEQVITEKIVLK